MDINNKYMKCNESIKKSYLVSDNHACFFSDSNDILIRL